MMNSTPDEWSDKMWNNANGPNYVQVSKIVKLKEGSCFFFMKHDLECGQVMSPLTPNTHIHTHTHTHTHTANPQT